MNDRKSQGIAVWGMVLVLSGGASSCVDDVDTAELEQDSDGAEDAPDDDEFRAGGELDLENLGAYSTGKPGYPTCTACTKVLVRTANTIELGVRLAAGYRADELRFRVVGTTLPERDEPLPAPTTAYQRVIRLTSSTPIPESAYVSTIGYSLDQRVVTLTRE